MLEMELENTLLRYVAGQVYGKPLLTLYQALLDVYTIRSELGTVNGRTITLLGDLKNGRTVHSLVTLLCIYSVRLNFVSPRSLSMPSSVVAAARKAGAFVQEFESLEEVLEETDVLYVTRVQKERFENDLEWQKVKDAYRVDHAVLARAKEEMIVMHPLPRVNGAQAMIFVSRDQY
jgi:carbamoyl-phosphate synthase/aspartate carbamoyltransferase